MLKNVYEGLNANSEVYLSKEYFCKMYPTCVSPKLCEFILAQNNIATAFPLESKVEIFQSVCEKLDEYGTRQQLGAESE